jgi:hypothetical protein
MKLTITNFGPVKGKQKYTIDLSKDFTLVTGGNGLGKTYLGYIVYGLIKSLNSPSTFPNKNSDNVLFGELKKIIITKENLVSFDLTLDKVKVFIDELINSYMQNINI